MLPKIPRWKDLVNPFRKNLTRFFLAIDRNSATTALPIMNKKELAASRYPKVIFEAGTMELRVA